MKILETQSAALSNAEVLSHLSNLSSKRQEEQENSKDKFKSPNYETVIKELTSYLEPTTVTPLPPYKAEYDAEKIRTLVQRLKIYNLTKAEMIMILNLRPQSNVLLDCIVEECDGRFSEDQQNEIIEIVRDVLGGDAMEVEGNGEMMDDA